MKKSVLLSFLFVFCLSYANTYHDFFVTITEIEYKENTKSVEIAVKIFTDDLEKALNSRFGGKTNLNTPKESAQTNSNLKIYLSERFSILVNEASQICQYVGKQKEDDATWCYLEVTDVASVTSMTVKNAILTELYESQNNIVHVKVRGKSKSMMLQRNAISGRVEF